MVLSEIDDMSILPELPKKHRYRRKSLSTGADLSESELQPKESLTHFTEISKAQRTNHFLASPNSNRSASYNNLNSKLKLDTSTNGSASSSVLSSNGQDSLNALIENHVLFKGLDKGFLQEMVKLMLIRTYNPQEFIIKKGDIGRTMFFLLRGVVEVISDDYEIVLNTMKEGSFFGEIGLLFSVPRTANCRASTKTHCIALTKEKFTKLVKAYPSVSEPISQVAEERFASYVRQQEQKIAIDIADELRLGVSKAALQDVPLFRDCEIGFLHTLALTAHPIRFSQGELICEKGKASNEMYFVLKGHASILDEKSGECLANFNPGSFFGEVGLLLSTTRTASVTAITTIDVFKLLKKDFDQTLEAFPEIKEKILVEAKQRNEYFQLRQKLSKIQDPCTEIDVVREKLKTISMFADKSDAFLHQVAVHVQFREFDEGNIIIKKGDVGKSLFLIIQGTAEVMSNEKVVAELGANSLFGEVSLFIDIVRTATVRAKTKCTLFELSSQGFQYVLDMYPEFESSIRAIAMENYKLFLAREETLKDNMKKLVSPEEAYGIEITTERLKKVLLFEHCGLNFLRSLALLTTIVAYKKDDFICRKGEKSTEMYLIINGSVEVVNEETGEIYDTMKKGDFFGEVGIIRDIERTASIKVRSPTCDIILLSSIALDRVLKDSIETYQKIVLEATKRYELNEKRLQKKRGSVLSKITNVFKRKKSDSKNSNEFKVGNISTTSSDGTKSTDSGSQESIDSSNSVTALDKEHDNNVPIPKNGKMIINKGKTTESIRNKFPVTITEKTKHLLQKLGPKKKSHDKPEVESKSTITYQSDEHLSKRHFIELKQEIPILLNVFKNLNIKDKKGLKMVCKEWNVLLSDPRNQTCMDFSPYYSSVHLLVLKHFCENSGPYLRTLNLTNCFKIGDNAMNGVSFVCKGLTSLSISGCWTITDRGISFISSRLKNLQYLNVSYCCQVNGSGFKDHEMKDLKHLDVSYLKQLNDDALETILSSTESLSSLSIRRCKKISDYGVFLVAKYCRKIQYLDFSDCSNFTDKTFQWLGVNCKKISYLNLSFCTNISSTEIGSIPFKIPNISELNISYCIQFSDANLKTLLEGDNGKKIKRLILRGCKMITDTLATVLIVVTPKLEFIDLNGCPNITANSIKILRDAFPEITIHHNKILKTETVGNVKELMTN